MSFIVIQSRASRIEQYDPLSTVRNEGGPLDCLEWQHPVYGHTVGDLGDGVSSKEAITQFVSKIAFLQRQLGVLGRASRGRGLYTVNRIGSADLC